MSDPLSILDAARECGDAPALSIGERTWSYAQLAHEVRRHGERLDAGLVGGAYPLIAHNTPAALLALYALLERRVPALLVDPRSTAAERDELLEAAASSSIARHVDAAVIVHTSGTTGRPRGVVLGRAALIASAEASAANLGWHEDDCWLACMPIARVGGLSIVTRSLAARRRVALAPRFEVARVTEWIDRHRATLVSLVPAMLARLLDSRPDWRPPDWLRAVLVGGAGASDDLLRRANERRVPIVVTYGATETCSQVVATPYEHRFEAADFGAGQPLANVALRVVDGRIEVRGPMLMSGYWSDAPRRADAWLDTGDDGAIDARGCLHVNGRRADLIVTGGDNVHPAEVERVLEAHPALAAAAVFGVADRTWGQTVAALLVARDARPTDAELRQWIGHRLAPHKRPRSVAFVETLPQTPQGKLDRNALQRFAQSLRPLNIRPGRDC
jgi:O-succinylbenzoic acid--CoA ligase